MTSLLLYYLCTAIIAKSSTPHVHTDFDAVNALYYSAALFHCYWHYDKILRNLSVRT